jgi:DNA-binding transcriptional LysR family regulator
VSNYDIAMVRSFVMVYETMSVGIAAEQLHVSQPAISYNLGKLRRHFDDPLFHKRNGRMAPTSLAEALYPELVEALARLDAVLVQPLAFDPATSTRTFTLATTDVGLVGLVPRLIQAISAQAPRVSLSVEPLQLSTAADELIAGRVDFVICTPLLHSNDLTRDVLFRQTYAGVCAPTHPRIGEAPTLEEYLAERHVAISPEVGHTVVPDRIAALGRSLDIAISVPNFTALPGIIAETEYLGFAPQLSAERLENTGTARAFTLPFDSPPAEVSLYMLGRAVRSAAGGWLRSLIIETLVSLDRP